MKSKHKSLLKSIQRKRVTKQMAEVIVDESLALISARYSGLINRVLSFIQCVQRSQIYSNQTIGSMESLSEEINILCTRNGIHVNANDLQFPNEELRHRFPEVLRRLSTTIDQMINDSDLNISAQDVNALKASLDAVMTAIASQSIHIDLEAGPSGLQSEANGGSDHSSVGSSNTDDNISDRQTPIYTSNESSE